jgi:hypothetical protein
MYKINNIITHCKTEGMNRNEAKRTIRALLYDDSPSGRESFRRLCNEETGHFRAEWVEKLADMLDLTTDQVLIILKR